MMQVANEVLKNVCVTKEVAISGSQKDVWFFDNALRFIRDCCRSTERTEEDLTSRKKREKATSYISTLPESLVTIPGEASGVRTHALELVAGNLPSSALSFIVETTIVNAIGLRTS